MFRLRVCRKAAACTCRAGYGGRPGRRGAATTSRTEAGRRGQRHPQTGGRAPGSGPASDEGFAAADLRLIAGAVPRPAQSRPQPPPAGRGAAPAPAMSAGLGCLPPTPQFSPVSQRASRLPHRGPGSSLSGGRTWGMRTGTVAMLRGARPGGGGLHASGRLSWRQPLYTQPRDRPASPP